MGEEGIKWKWLWVVVCNQSVIMYYRHGGRVERRRRRKEKKRVHVEMAIVTDAMKDKGMFLNSWPLDMNLNYRIVRGMGLMMTSSGAIWRFIESISAVINLRPIHDQNIIL